ncbi:MAG: Trehalose synthase [Myxococcaceae bacterium]|nr:Trehalose synthase [Myxococcaceae bacterium]
MLDLVDVGERSVDSYRGVAPDQLLEQLREVSRKLQGARVLHLNATPYGGGVSELLRSIVPLLNDLGLKAEWRIVTGNQSFFEVTKAIHNGLQGGLLDVSPAQQTAYLETSRVNARAFSGEYDFVFIHDPQPAGILAFRDKEAARWIWRCHIDTSCPNRQIWSFLRPFIARFDAAIFTLPDFIPPDFPLSRIEIIAPAIDPQSPKNLPLPEPIARQLLEWIGVRTQRPLVTQVSRFDPWKDPLGVIHAYRLARAKIPELQLALVGSLALDDPGGWDIYRGIEAEVEGDPLIHVFTNLVGVGNIEVNAFQTLSAVTIQKSLREGFGLVVSESLWKGTPVVAGRTGGIPMQMPEGVGGILVDTVEECAEGIVTLVSDRERAKALGASGRDRVREHFLIPRLVRDELALMSRLAAGD